MYDNPINLTVTTPNYHRSIYCPSSSGQISSCAVCMRALRLAGMLHEG
jgi:hypothetical protein